MNDCIVIIPTYNEIENIESIIRSVLSQHKPFHILIVDDNSPDRTADRVRLLQTEFSGRLFLENREKKSGLGTAYVHGFKWALQRKYDFIFEMDADFSHNPNDLEKLYNACHFGNADLAIGSRYVTGVNVVNWPLNRVLMSYFASVYVRIITGMKIHDATAGFICYKREVLAEIPIIFTDRTKGESKMSNSIIIEAVFGVISLRLKKLVNSL
jgi:dolichol-phosphate mannosyltransferase